MTEPKQDGTSLRKLIEHIRTASSVDAVRTMMRNAEIAMAQGRLDQSQVDTVQRVGWRRLAELAGQDADDPLTRKWLEGIAAFEALTGKRASRTRPMLDRHGAKGAFEKLVDRPAGTAGFEQMIASGMHDMTAEWIVLEFPDDFEDRTRAMAEERLAAAGVVSRP